MALKLYFATPRSFCINQFFDTHLSLLELELLKLTKAAPKKQIIRHKSTGQLQSYKCFYLCCGAAAGFLKSYNCTTLEANRVLQRAASAHRQSKCALCNKRVRFATRECDLQQACALCNKRALFATSERASQPSARFAAIAHFSLRLHVFLCRKRKQIPLLIIHLTTVLQLLAINPSICQGKHESKWRGILTQRSSELQQT